MNKFNELLAAKSGVNIKKVNTIKGQINKLESNKFDKQIELSRICCSAEQWFKLAETKQHMKDAEIEMTMDKFGNDTFGFKRSQWSLYRQVGNLLTEKEELLATFIADREEKVANNETPNKSLKALKDWMINDGVEEAEAEAEAEAEEEAEAEAEEKTNYIVSFAIKGEHFEDGKGVSIRIAESGIVEGDIEKIPSGLRKELAKLSSQIALKQPNAIVETKGKSESK
jgi:hypothetical protein